MVMIGNESEGNNRNIKEICKITESEFKRGEWVKSS